MSLTSGTHVGPYTILALPGAGGMGEMDRARDTRLGRDVAIKTLRAGFAGSGRHTRALVNLQADARFEEATRGV